jgi:pre-mRNA-processing factor 19
LFSFFVQPFVTCFVTVRNFLSFLVSNQVPKEPVVSKKTGLLFDKNLILKYINEKGVCPVTKETLTAEDLLEVKSEKISNPRTVQTTSIPGLLQVFQNEWDSLMLESFTLKEHIQEVFIFN